MTARDTVFAVDDDPAVLRSIERLLRAYGYRAQGFHSADDFRRHARLAEALCLVLDIDLAGKSGIDLRRQLAARDTVPVIFITGNDSDAIREEALKAGCIAYLTKPVPVESLLVAIEQARHAAD